MLPTDSVGVVKTKKQLARQRILNAIQRGEIVPPEACSACKQTPNAKYLMEAHHEDYNKPLDVVWLCLACHRKLHRKPVRRAEPIGPIWR